MFLFNQLHLQFLGFGQWVITLLYSLADIANKIEKKCPSLIK